MFSTAIPPKTTVMCRSSAMADEASGLTAERFSGHTSAHGRFGAQTTAVDLSASAWESVRPSYAASTDHSMAFE